METIVFLDRGTVTVPFRKPAFLHEWVDYERTLPEETMGRIRHATVVVTNKVKLRGPELEAAPNLKLIAVTATGFDNIDLEFCRKRSILVSNIPGYARGSVPEHAMMLMLALRRNLPAYLKIVREERWQHSPQPTLNDIPVEDLRGSTLGLIGYGDLAKGVERLARAFGMKILIAARKNENNPPLVPGTKVGLYSSVGTVPKLEFNEVLKQSDVVSLHVPLNEETRNLIGPAELALMKPTALLINTARGGLVDEKALAEALRSGHLGGAGVDVLSTEPPREGNPLLDLKLPHLIVTPHIAWTSRQAQEVLAEEVVKNIEAFAAGKPRNIVS
jgi:glycerate dehydrogenase